MKYLPVTGTPDGSRYAGYPGIINNHERRANTRGKAL